MGAPEYAPLTTAEFLRRLMVVREMENTRLRDEINYLKRQLALLDPARGLLYSMGYEAEG